MNRIDRLIVGCPSWAALWAALTTSTEVDPGEAFERLTQLYLQSHPEYRTQLEHVWRVPEEVPPRIRQRLNLPSTDEGIDLLARTHDGKFWAIQCKFRSDTKKPLTYGELSTFTSLAFVTCKDISLAVVAHTCSKPVRKHQYLGNATEIGLDRWLGLTDEDWQGIQAQIKGKLAKLKPRSPRPHQQAAIEAARKHFATEARGRMIMPCATGKSLTAFWIARALDAKSIIVAVPSLALIRQSLLDWTREYLAHGEEPQWLVVCSDESTGKLEQDEFVGQTYDLGIPTTTKAEDIVPFLRRRTGRRIVFTTYQSSGTLANAAREAGVRIDLAILDEAHKTVGVKSKAFATLLSDASIPVQRRLFMTATERVLRGESDDVFSMDDETVYGQRFHQLTFKDAIAQGIISDYKILTITVSDQTIRDLVAENRLIDVKGDETDAQSLAAAVALRRSFEKHGITHAISFHRSIKAASTFADRQVVLDDAMQSPLTSLHVSSKKSAGERAELMREFVGEQRALMTNARCLTEGVDVPAIDCVLFADPKQSVVDIVQAAGRALRPYPGKQYGYILLPLVVPAGMEIGTFAETTEFKQVARTITALSTQDERIAEQFRVVEHGRKPTGKIVEIEGDVAVGQQLDVAEFADQIGTRIWERVAKVNWRPFDEARSFVRSLGLEDKDAWSRWCQGRIAGTPIRPTDIPAAPWQVYRGHGWHSFGDWLATGRRRGNWRTFAEARGYVRTLGLTSAAEWKRFVRGKIPEKGRRPEDIPAKPEYAYAGLGWIGWDDWLGVERYRISPPISSDASASGPYVSFEIARQFARSLNLQSSSQWDQFCKGGLPEKGRLPADIPATPRAVYRNQGWLGFADWLGQGRRVGNWMEFKQAKRFVHALGIRSFTEWQMYATGRSAKFPPKPIDIPASPAKVYRANGWLDWGDWLGTKATPRPRGQWREFERARAFVRTLRLNNVEDWAVFSKSGRRPTDIPTNPAVVYRNKGWAGMRDWLGVSAQIYRAFDEARQFARALGLNSAHEWRAYARSSNRPLDIPAKPQVAYASNGWVGMRDWLGTTGATLRAKRYRAFDTAREFAHGLGLKSYDEWRAYAGNRRPDLGKRPEDIPGDPSRTYKDSGWRTWGDWLGTNSIAVTKRVYREFGAARAFAQELRLQGEGEWRRYVTGESGDLPRLPADIPSAPNWVYRSNGWTSWSDWLGTRKGDRKQEQRRRFRSFADAKSFARGLQLRTVTEWRKYVRDGISGLPRKPIDIPSNPYMAYIDEGWAGWPDWLGTEAKTKPGTSKRRQ